MKEKRITIPMPADLVKRLEAYAARHTDGNLAAAVRRIVREVVK